ncbi:hypothetical protein [Clostridium sp. JS66]|nr:hypothetical protein [Clostridium sp. JS66]WPC42376.1 hypothetical protein Q6H37_02625 [Clostridium sp. JS66]
MNESMAIICIAVIAIAGIIVVGCVCMKCITNIIKYEKNNEHEE